MVVSLPVWSQMSQASRRQCDSIPGLVPAHSGAPSGHLDNWLPQRCSPPTVHNGKRLKQVTIQVHTQEADQHHDKSFLVEQSTQRHRR